eukprot:TRINITY_DN4059_c0_g1_i12.p1 TRINITY_DN4059_c0_g1~~TRINITY_DN4059_c0_g1_i12.p1  ORF type:complete len:346 (-),score=28.18 TRINITY_DN4059_c0_g1_i12:535-1572(-)
MESSCQALRRIPEILWYQIFKNLTIKEFVKLRLISHKFQEYVNHFLGIYERECLRIFTSDLEVFGYSHLHCIAACLTATGVRKSREICRRCRKRRAQFKASGCSCCRKEAVLNVSGSPLLKKLELNCSPLTCGSHCVSLYLRRCKASIGITVDPPVPLPELRRDDFNAYRESILQDHLYGMIFHESDHELQLQHSMQNSIFTDQIGRLEEMSEELITECMESEYTDSFLELRWYSNNNLKSRLLKKSGSSSLTTETVCSMKYKADPNYYDLKLIKQVSDIKSKLSPTLVRLLYAILETIKYYCKLTKQYIMKECPLSEIMGEYCRRVTSLLNATSGTATAQQCLN